MSAGQTLPESCSRHSQSWLNPRGGFRALLLLLLLPLAACGVSSKPIEGRVVDAETKKPLAGAIVIGRWEKTQSILMADSRTYFAHVETAATDGDGRYRMPQWEGRAPSYLDAYQAGYEKYWPAGYGSTEDFKRNVLYLAPFKGSREERLKYLERSLDATRCGTQDDTERNLYVLYSAMYEEAKKIAVSKADGEIVDTLRYWASFVILDKSRPTTRDAKGRLINVRPN